MASMASIDIKAMTILHCKNTWKSGVAVECYQKYWYIKKHEKMVHVMTDDELSHIKDLTSEQCIQEELNIKNLLPEDRVFKSFDEALNNNIYGFHITQIPPSNMLSFNKED
jgi:hypothetical protein